MSDNDRSPYPPINTLKPVAENVWLADGPIIRFGMPWPKMPFPTRMTVIRIEEGLFVHSPTQLVPSLKREIEAIGSPRWIIAPNRIHYWWVPDWHAAFPSADVYLAPRVREQAGSRIAFESRELMADRGYPWDRDVETLPIAGSFMTEVEFFHRASRTLILTDLIENFEPAKLGFLMRWLTWLGGVQHPHGSMPRDMRLTFSTQRAALKVAVERMIAWNPERIILAHGKYYDRDGAAQLKRAFRWLLA